MSTNRSNNRRRGRGNNRGQGGGGQINRIDSRARGNAPQLLEKYKKLAHDASLNDDRVQTEYYLQFADHYFRVLSDSRSPKDEYRARRDNDRDDSDDDGQDDDSAPYDRGQDQRSSGNGNANSNSGRDDRRDDRGQQRRSPQRPETGDDDDWSGEGVKAREGEDAENDTENPFLRDSRPRPARSRGGRQPAAAPQGDGTDGMDPSSLPPSIARKGDGASSASGDDEAEPAPAKAPRAPRVAKPRAPRTRARPPRADDGDSEALEAVS